MIYRASTARLLKTNAGFYTREWKERNSKPALGTLKLNGNVQRGIFDGPAHSMRALV